MLSTLIARTVYFFRTGYAAGTTRRGYVPLLALCRRQLSDAEVSAVARQLMLTGSRTVDGTDMRVAITKLVDDLPSLEDANRVNRRLLKSGWQTTD